MDIIPLMMKDNYKQSKITVMKATINFQEKINAQVHRKENNFMEEYLGLAVVGNQIRTAVNLRIYGTDSRNYCCVWINNGQEWGAGSDYAGGYGYHRPSAAAHGALIKAGVQLSEPIDGRGDSAIKEAVLAVLDALYPESEIKSVIKAHA
jgi:hypothetical protein